MGNETSVDPERIRAALQRVHDQSTFIHELLADTLDWPVQADATELDEITYEWGKDEGKAPNVEQKLVGGRILEMNLTGSAQHWGIFVLEFKSPDVFSADRGMTGVLREVLRWLVPRRRNAPDKRSWDRDHLLFICTHDYKQFRFAYFLDPVEEQTQPRLAAFGWEAGATAIRTVCEFNLSQLGWPEDPSKKDAWVEQWAAAFDVDRVTKHFYEDYAEEDEKLRRAVAPLLRETDCDAEPVKMFVQTLLNRLMFLRFIERKGWLHPPGGGNRREYLRELFAQGRYQGKSFYQGRLHRLFFAGLAVLGKQESAAIGKVPFLNGGLFEESKLDKKVAHVPDDVFIPLLGAEGLFYRYNFTVEESTPLNVEVAVDPEMLGKVFEELVTRRHESGSYYTPRPIVAFMCRESLKGYLGDATKLGADKVADFVDRHETKSIDTDDAGKIADALQHLKAVDPACGSGAYLLGLLHEIVELYQLIYRPDILNDPIKLHELKLRIISNSIYGVDVDQFATTLAKLRLWLSLSVDSETPLPLPNLDFKIEAGDSLGGPDPSAMPDLFREKLQREADDLVQKKKDYLNCHDETKHTKLVELQMKEKLISKALQSNVGEGVIDWRIQFAEVFALNGGFDVVLANPPYISAMEFSKRKPREQREALNQAYRSARGAYDLYVLFFERGVQLLREGGYLSFITPNKYLSAKYAVALREYLLSETSLLGLVDVSGVPVFARVSVYPVLTMLTKQRRSRSAVNVWLPRERGLEQFALEDYREMRLPAEVLTLLPENIWGFLLSPHISLLKKVIDGATPLAALGKVNATTTAAEADEFGDSLVERTSRESFKVVNTGTIDPFAPLWGMTEMTHKGMRFLRPSLPAAAVNERRRAMYRAGKVIFAKMAKNCEAFLDNRGEYAALNANCFYEPVFSVDLAYVCGFANSALFMFLYTQFFGALRMAGGYFQFQSPQLRVVPLRVAPNEQQAAIARLVREAQELAGAGGTHSIERIVDQIDEHFYRLYELSTEEIDVMSALVGRRAAPPDRGAPETVEEEVGESDVPAGPASGAVDEWVGAVRDLIAVVEGWARRRGWAVSRQEKTITETKLGRYSVPALIMKPPSGVVQLEPVARYVGNATGRVDILAFPSMNRMVLIRGNAGWTIKTDAGVEWPEQWGEEVFARLVDVLHRED